MRFIDGPLESGASFAATATIPISLQIVTMTVGRTTLEARRNSPSDDWQVSFQGLGAAPWGKVTKTATARDVQAAMLRFLFGIE